MVIQLILNLNKSSSIGLFSWTEQGYKNYGNFLSLIKERNQEMLFDMDSENNAFPKELLL